MIEYENLALVNQPYKEQLLEQFKQVLNSGWFVLGNAVAEFENKFANYVGVKNCAGVASGLDALYIGLKILDLPLGSEVIVPSNTYIATILAIINAGLKPVLVEPDIRTYNIDPAKIAQAITSKTKALMVVHLYGKICQMDAIMDLCKNNKLFLIEDCAQAHGAKFKNQMAGSFGDVSAFSFYPTKNLGALGDAGAITTNSDKLHQKVKMYRNYGSSVKYYNEVQGINSRLDEIQASFLCAKLPSLDNVNDHKRKLAQIYLKNLKDQFIKPVISPDCFDVYHIFNIRHKERDLLKKYLFDHGVKTEIHYPVPPHKQKAMIDIFSSHDSFPIAEEIHNTTLSLPISYATTETEVHQVIELMNKFN